MSLDLDCPISPAPRPAGAAAPEAAQKVMVGDCIAVMKTMVAGSVDVVVTSPPYNIGVKYNAYDDRRARAEYLRWLQQVGHEIARVLADDGSFFLNVGGSNRDPWTPLDVAQALRSLFALQNHVVWIKSISIGEDTVGHFKPISSDRFLNNNFEHVFHFTKKGATWLDRLAVGVPFKDKSNIGRWGHKADRRCRGNTWFIPYKTVRSKTQKYNHPCTFPVELAEMCIKLHGGDDPIVLDPFVGTGTTLVAAKRLGVRGLGVELDPVYAAAAQERLREEDLAGG